MAAIRQINQTKDELRLASLRLSSTIESIKSKKFDLLMKLIEPRMKAISRNDYYNSIITASSYLKIQRIQVS